MAHGDNTGKAARRGHAVCVASPDASPPGRHLLRVRARARVRVRARVWVRVRVGVRVRVRVRVRVHRRKGTPRPPAFLRGIEARSVADEQLAVEGAHVGEAEMLRCEALAGSPDAPRHVIVLAQPTDGLRKVFHPRADGDVVHPWTHHPEVVLVAPELLHEQASSKQVSRAES